MSMLCPRCQEKLNCLDTRRQEEGTVKRAYKCGKCGARVYSVEVMTRFKEAKGKDAPTADELARKARARATLAAEILTSQGINI